MAKKESMKELLVTKVQSLYDIESELVETLPLMAEAASNTDLKDAFNEHLEETRGQVARLLNIFELLDEKPEKLKSEAIRGLADDAQWCIKNIESGSALDAALIASARSVEHFEMSKYIVAHEWAELLGEEDVSELLSETFEEEEGSDEKLGELGTEIATSIGEEILD